MNKVVCIILLSVLGFGPMYSQRKRNVAFNPYEELDRKVNEWNYSVNSIAELSEKINSTFESQKDRCRAIFYWVTSNINYSIDLIFTYQTSSSHSKMCAEAFDKRKAVCIGYAALVDSLCKLSGIRSFIVEGSTRQDFLASVIGHAYNAVLVDDKWQLLDATWGGGYLVNKQFVRRLDNSYFMPKPGELIKTHLPFDPIWQLLDYPVTLTQFFSNESSGSTYWNFSDTIKAYFQLSEVEKTKATFRRLKEFGTESETTLNYYHYLESKKDKYYVDKYNMAIKPFNQAVKDFNNYITFKNAQFTPAKSDQEISEILPAIVSKMNGSEFELMGLNGNLDADNQELLTAFKDQIKDLREKVESEKTFVKKYLSTPKSKRRDLFYTRIYYKK